MGCVSQGPSASAKAYAKKGPVLKTLLRWGLLSLGMLSTKAAVAQTPPSRADQLTPYHLFMEPTEPVPLARVIPEWEAHQALVLALPVRSALRHPDEFRYYKELVEATLPIMPVVVAINRDNANLSMVFLQRLKRSGFSDTDIDGITILNAHVGVRWIRDFGPFYGETAQGEVVLIDTLYGNGFFNFFTQAQEHSKAQGVPLLQEITLRAYASDENSLEDRFPNEIARFVRRSSHGPVRVVRPPLFLEGGDFLQDGRGHVFLSQRTLYDNGGQEARLSEIVRNYFGQAQVHYLRELPGDNIEHLDYVLKFVSPDTCLVAVPYGEFTNTTRQRRLSEDTRSALAYNIDYLRTHFPDLNLIPVPFVPPARDSQEKFLEGIRNRLIRQVAWRNGLISEDAYRREASAPVEPDIQSAVAQKIRAELQLDGLDDEPSLERAAQHYFKMTLNELRDIHTDSVFYYRSHLNSQLLRNREGRERFLLPRYAPNDQHEAAWMPQVEAEVERAYRKARPQADIVWIDSDVMAFYGGAIHCTTHLLPLWPQVEREP